MITWLKNSHDQSEPNPLGDERRMNKTPLSNGMIDVVRETTKLFDNAAGRLEKTRHAACEGHGCLKCYGKGFLTRDEQKALRLRDKALADAGEDLIISPCRRCEGVGYITVFGHSGKLRDRCPTCKGTRYVEDKFRADIVKLAYQLQHQTPLVIAKTLVGLMMGMRP